MTDFENSVSKEIEEWATDSDYPYAFRFENITAYWNEYFNSCEMANPETGLEVI
jgi:hypothetical protein